MVHPSILPIGVPDGNPAGVKRYGLTGDDAYGLADDLTFTYRGNQMGSINGNKYSYDGNGNQTQDLSKNVSRIQYNFLNLPDTVTFTDGSEIVYTYGSDGVKYRVVHIVDSISSVRNYCGNVIYEDSVPMFLLTETGYITLTDKVYHFYLKDHQGNVRVVVDQSNAVEEVNHYYPFGGLFASSGNVQPYKYNGKELDTVKGLNWYDYGARHYDASVGCFTTVDPLAENDYSVSPYAYCGSNPVRYIDPTGMFYTGYIIDRDGYIQKVNNEGGNSFDVLYNAHDYSSAKVKDYDTTGDKVGIRLSKGMLNELAGAGRNMSAKVLRGVDLDVKGRTIANHSYEIKSDKESLNIMNFLDKNTDVEWGNTLLQDAQKNRINHLMTSHEGITISMGSYQINKYIRKGYQVIRADHIHPTAGAIDASGKTEGRKGDKGNAMDILQHSPDAIFRILNQGRYYPYKP